MQSACNLTIMSTEDTNNNNVFILKAGGARSRVEEDEAMIIAKRFEDEIAVNANAKAKAGTPVTTILDLSCRSWPRRSLEKLRPVLSQVSSTVAVLKIDDIIASLPTDEGLDSLKYFADVFATSDVVEIDLSDNALGSRGDQVLLPLFKLPTLKKLAIDNCGMSKEVTQSLLTSICDKPLTHLRLGRNQIGHEGAPHVQKLIANCPSIEVFHYDGCRPLKEGTRAILQGLATMADSVATTALTDLNLHDCTFGDDDDADEDNASAIVNLVRVLQKSPNLKILNLQDGEIGAEGLDQVLQALVKSGAEKGLVSLSLGGCELGEEGSDILAEFINNPSHYLSHLEDLTLDTNELADYGVETLTNALCSSGASKLMKLNFECNEIEKSGAKAMYQNKLPNLKELNILDNMDIPRKWGDKLVSLYDKVLIDEDLDEGDDDNEDDADAEQIIDDLAGQLSGL